MRKLCVVCCVLCVVFIALFASYFFITISLPATDSSEEEFFVVKKGQGVNEISGHLKNKNLIRSSLVFEIYLWLLGAEKKVQAGEYKVKKNLSIVKLTSVLLKGKTSNERRITIPEGWNNQEIAEYLEKEDIVSREEFLTMAKNLEGYLFPDTYRIFKDTTAEDIIKKMQTNFDKKTANLREEISKQGKTLEEIIIMASLVEEEGKTESDRQKIAGIFWQRLSIGKPLESDATVNYITGKKITIPSSTDLQTSSPYNTYQNFGLPAGPISNPGLESIKAALYPEETEYLYFLNTPDGQVLFSETYEEHLEKRTKYYE